MAASVISSAVKKFASPVLPFVTKLGNSAISVTVQDFDLKYLDETEKLYAEEVGKSYHKDEVTGEGLRQRLTEGKCVLFLEEKTNEVACCFSMLDSILCRSSNSFLASMYAVVAKEFRGKGLVRDAYNTVFPINMGLGYLGFLTRAPLTTRNILPSIAVGAQVACTVPLCSYIENFGYVDNVTLFLNHQLDKIAPEYYQEIIDKRNVSLPVLNTDEAVAKKHNVWNELPTVESKTKDGMIRIESVREPEEVVEAHKLMREAAEKGYGFAIDEFDKDGYCNLKFFKNCDVLVARSTSGEIVGTAVQGPSLMARNANPVIAHQYMAVKDEHRGKGIAGSLLKYSIKNLKSQGYEGVVSDTYVTNHNAVDMLSKYKFQFVGSLPYCGYIKGIGARDSLLVYIAI